MHSPLAPRADLDATQSKTPYSLPSSDSSIMPMRNRYTSEPSITALPASRRGIRRRTMRSSSAPEPTHHTSGMFRGRTSMSNMLRAAMVTRRMWLSRGDMSTTSFHSCSGLAVFLTVHDLPTLPERWPGRCVPDHGASRSSDRQRFEACLLLCAAPRPLP